MALKRKNSVTFFGQKKKHKNCILQFNYSKNEKNLNVVDI